MRLILIPLNGLGLLFTHKYAPYFLAWSFMTRSLTRVFHFLPSFSVNCFYFQEYMRLFLILGLDYHLSFSQSPTLRGYYVPRGTRQKRIREDKSQANVTQEKQVHTHISVLPGCYLTIKLYHPSFPW